MRTLFGLRLPAAFARFVVTFAVLCAAPGIASAASYAGVVIDAKTGKTLYSHRADATAYPASLTKMMTLYMLFEQMEAGRISKSTRIPVSARAASMQPSKLGIKAGGSVSAEQAILSLVTKSANDIAVAVAEKLGGSESEFAVLMTRKARTLGMSKTTFKNASGLPNSAQVTTARDMATLGIALREHFPGYYKYFSTRSFTYGRKRMGNHNRLLGKVRGMDGIKTGYTRASGFNLVSSVKADDRSIVAVVMGGKSGGARNAQMQKLVASYLPRASKGSDRMLVAKTKSSQSIQVALAKMPKETLKENVPSPSNRGEEKVVASRVETAHTEARLVSLSDAAFDTDAIRRKLLEMSGKELPVPLRSPTSGKIDRIITASSNAARAGQDIATRPQKTETRKPEGFLIQIGATPSENSAQDLLASARQKAPGVLSGVASHTETVEKGDEVLYRARFAGFQSMSSAKAACSALKKKRFACLAIAAGS